MTHATLLWSIWQALLEPFAWAFTRPGFRRFAERVTALEINPEEHTITQSVTALDRIADGKALETFAESGAWRTDSMSGGEPDTEEIGIGPFPSRDRLGKGPWLRHATGSDRPRSGSPARRFRGTKMSVGETLDLVPLWVVYLATVASSVLSFEGGFRLGRYRHGRSAQEDKPPVGEMVGATLGLLAFMLAFTFGLSASRFDLRKGLVLDETNALGTTYMRARLLPEPQRTEVRDLLRAYVDVRLEDVPPAEQQQAIARLGELQGRLWARAVAVSEQSPNSIVVELFIESINEMIDLHAKRVTLDLRNRIPGIIWAALFFVAILGMAVLGYHSGLAAPRRSLAILPLILTFSAVMWLIADLDRPREGYLRVSQQAMMDLRESWRAPAP